MRVGFKVNLTLNQMLMIFEEVHKGYIGQSLKYSKRCFFEKGLLRI